MRFNPFRPNNTVAPGMFTGRVNEIQTVCRCLFQAKNGNPVHFLIQGERGIGKSSLCEVIDDQARGADLFQDGKLNFLVISVDLSGAESQLDIVRAIAWELRSELEKREVLKHKAKAVVDWALNWEILGVKYRKEEQTYDPRRAADELISQVAALCTNLEDVIDGVLILIDEADRPGQEAGLGALCKMFTERLARQSCTKVVLGLAGLPPLMQQLKSSHESSPRLFTILVLAPLLRDECKAVIERGLEVAKKTNGHKIEIDDNALELLASLSEGYPHFIQQFGYSAFEACRGATITIDDVLDGAFGENGALSQLGTKFFSEMYHLKIASDDYRKVLHTMAAHTDNWVARKDLLKESGLSLSTVTNALNALKARQIILADESRKNKGFYRLPTRSFAAWLNAMESVSEKTGKSIPEVGGQPQN